MKKITAFDLHISPLCRAGFAGPIFTTLGSYRRRNHPCQILGRLVKGLGGYGSPKWGVSHWLWMSLLQQCYALTCHTVKTRGMGLTVRWKFHNPSFNRFYRAMHFGAKRGIAIACRLSVRLSVCLSVCNVGELWSHRLEFFENNFTVS